MTTVPPKTRRGHVFSTGKLPAVQLSFPRSIRSRMLLSMAGIFLLLVFSTGYILLSAKNLQTLLNRSFEQERFIKSIQDDLEAYQGPLLDYLSTRSSNALAKILIDSQALRFKIPSYISVTSDKAALRERELYFLIHAYLNLAEQAMEEKRGRNITAYTRTYNEMSDLLVYINAEIDSITIERFRNQMNNYGLFIAAAGDIQILDMLFIIFISVLVVLLLLSAVSSITAPLVRLSSMAVELSMGNFNIDDIATGSVKEMDQVVEAFNRMKKEIRNYIEEIRWQENIKEEYMRERMRNMKMEGLVRHMEIYTLQAQMNPHFLFNTLNTGMQLAIVEGADRTSEYMEYLAKLFRHNIRNKEIIVPLRHEIEGLNYYFYILKVRFPKNLDLVLDYGESLLDSCKVPVSILQPLVENCVIHAFKDTAAETAEQAIRNLIMVKVEKQGGRLVLLVRDNGRGIDKETAEILLHPQHMDEPSVSRLTGLENVIQRLYFFYPGDPQVISIESETGKGSAITICIDTGREPCIAF
ncbi:MAG: histidine kinase [Treponema sp.]|jgi:sensor histidine kinase YesM|nr:histidine kinase [Treponema sp.]